MSLKKLEELIRQTLQQTLRTESHIEDQLLAALVQKMQKILGDSYTEEVLNKQINDPQFQAKLERVIANELANENFLDSEVLQSGNTEKMRGGSDDRTRSSKSDSLEEFDEPEAMGAEPWWDDDEC